MNNYGLGIALNLKGNFSRRIATAKAKWSGFRSSVRTGAAGIRKGVSGALNKFGGFVAVTGSLVALAAGFKKATAEAMKFGSSMAEVSTLLDEQQKDIMPKLTSEVKRLSKAYGMDLNTSAKALYQTISAGVSPEKATKFMDLAGKLAVGGVTDIQTAVDGLTNMKNAFGLSMKDMTRVSDEMFVTMKLGKTTIDELSRSVGGVAPVASTMGLSTKEMLASIGDITKVGLTTSEAATGLKGILSTIIKQTPATLKAAKQYGLTMDQSIIKQKGFKWWLGEVAKLQARQPEALGKIFRRVQALNGVLALTSKKGMKDYNHMLESMEKGAGATGEAFKKIAATPEFLQKKMKVAFQSMWVSIGNLVMPTISVILKGLIFLANGIEKVANVLKGFPVWQLWILKGLLLLIAAVVLYAIVPAFWAWAVAAMANPIVWIILAIIVAIVALIGIFYLVNKYWDKIVAGFVKGWNWVKKLFLNVWKIMLKFAGIIAIFMPFIGIPLLIIKYWKQIKTFFVNLWKGIVDGVKNIIGAVWDWVYGKFGKIIDFVVGIAKAIVNAISNVFVKMGKALWNSILAVWSGIKWVLKKLGILKSKSTVPPKIKIDTKTTVSTTTKTKAKADKGSADSTKKATKEGILAGFKGSKTQTNVQVNNKVNIGNEKVHESQTDYIKEYNLRNFVYVR